MAIEKPKQHTITSEKHTVAPLNHLSGLLKSPHIALQSTQKLLNTTVSSIK
jgi:hypothetical protein